jgi:hypothetical protein
MDFLRAPVLNTYFSVFSENLGRLVYSAFLLSISGLVMSESFGVGGLELGRDHPEKPYRRRQSEYGNS